MLLLGGIIMILIFQLLGGNKNYITLMIPIFLLMIPILQLLARNKNYIPLMIPIF